MKTHNIRYIVVHSTKSIPGNLPVQTEFNFLITSNGLVLKPVALAADAGCISIGYAGGIDRKNQPANTMNELQEEKLFELLIMQSAKHKRAEIKGANVLYNDALDTGFNLDHWLNNYTPKIPDDYSVDMAA